MSTGLRSEAPGGRNSASRSRTAAGSSGTSTPSAWQASAHITPGPPALEMIATRSPRGIGCAVSRAATPKRSWSVSARITPACSNSASTVTSEADRSAPVCVLTALAPALERPLLTASSGLRRANRGAMRANLRGLPNDSR